MEIKFSKKRIFISIILGIAILALLIIFRKVFIINNTFYVLPFIGGVLATLVFCAIIAIPIKVNEKYNKKFTIFNIIFSTIFIAFIVELLNENNLFTINIIRLLFNFILIGCVYLFFICLTNKLKLSLIISNILIFGIGFANYSITSLRKTPLSLLDVLSIGTGLTIADTYTLIVNFYLILAIICFAILLAINLKITHSFIKNKKNIIKRISTLIIVMVFVTLIFTTDLIKIFNLETNLWKPNDEYHSNGFLASFVKQAKDLIIKKPKNYSVSYVEDIYYEALDSVSASIDLENNTPIDNQEIEEKPNIIVIMNESYSDMQVHHKFATNIDYMPYFRSLCENTLSGTVHSSVYGGKTPNSEWEFLTNNSMAFFSYGSVPYQQFIRDNTYSLATTLKAQGYSTSAIHTWYKTGYRRSSVYPLIGFDKFIALEDVENELDFIRNYPSDLSTYKQLVKLFENKGEDELFFNFTLTMQNHSGYDYAEDDFTPTVSLTDIKNCPKVEQYLSLIKESDEALKYLINYFENVDEKTIILFFGDHQPPYIEQEFWDYINQGKSDDSLADAEKGYLTPYFIWANYDLPEVSVPDISLNYLSMLLLDIAGLDSTPYQDFLRKMQEEIPVITGHGYMDKTGTYHNLDEENDYSSIIKDYQILQYNNMFGRKNIVKEMFTVK